MSKYTNLKFGQLLGDYGVTFVQYTNLYISPNGTSFRNAEFMCSCGKLFTARIYSITRSETKSCGCLLTSGVNFKHGQYKSKLYAVLRGMKARCYNEKNKHYNSYGGRGILIHQEWLHSISSFIDWAHANGYKEGLSIDRIDVNGNYEPYNCRWVTQVVQAQNTRLLGSRNTSGYRGVYLTKSGKYRCIIKSINKTHSLGTFSTAEEAARAYDAFVISNGTAHPLNFKLSI